MNDDDDDHIGLEPAASIHSSLWLGALGHVRGGHVRGRPHLSPRVLPFTSVTHFTWVTTHFIDPGRMKG